MTENPTGAATRFRAVWYMLLVSLGYFTFTRLFLLARSFSDAELSPGSLVRILGTGMVYDLAFPSMPMP